MIDNNLMDDNYISIDDAAAYFREIKDSHFAQLDKEKIQTFRHIVWGNSGSLSVLNLMNG